MIIFSVFNNWNWCILSLEHKFECNHTEFAQQLTAKSESSSLLP